MSAADVEHRDALLSPGANETLHLQSQQATFSAATAETRKTDRWRRVHTIAMGVGKVNGRDAAPGGVLEFDMPPYGSTHRHQAIGRQLVGSAMSEPWRGGRDCHRPCGTSRCFYRGFCDSAPATAQRWVAPVANSIQASCFHRKGGWTSSESWTAGPPQLIVAGNRWAR